MNGRAAQQQENAQLRELVGSEPRMIGVSPAFRRVVEQAEQVARSNARILLQGESGIGKELVAAHLHRQSPFASGPFIKVNCAARGLVEAGVDSQPIRNWLRCCEELR